MTDNVVEQSIEELQTKFAYLESAVTELSDVVFRQQREIQALKEQIEALRHESSEAPSSSLGPERPPHY